MHLIILLLIAIGVPATLHIIQKKQFTFKEFVVQALVISLLIFGGYQMSKWNSMSDTEYHNGRVSAKEHFNRSCSHSYECNCTCISYDENLDCTFEICDTCYDHNRDYFWDLGFTTGDNVRVETCGDCRGKEVPLWDKAYIGEPATIPHSYTNYLLADPESLLETKGVAEQFSSLPNHPEGFGLYKANRFVSTDVTVHDTQAWNDGLAEINADLGAKKEVTISVVATYTKDPMFSKGLEEKWLFGDKNDLTYVFGVDDKNQVAWARVVSFSAIPELRVRVRNEAPGLNLNDVQNSLSYIRATTNQYFERTSMETISYLKSASKPSPGGLALLYVLTILSTGFAAAYFLNEDPFYSRIRRYRRY